MLRMVFRPLERPIPKCVLLLLNRKVLRNFTCSGLRCTVPNSLCTDGSPSIRDQENSFPDAKSAFNRVINEAYFVLDMPVPKVEVEQISTGNPNDPKFWLTKIKMCWPGPFEVRGISSKKAESEKFAFINACMKLKEYGYLDHKNHPVIPCQHFEFKGQTLKNPKSDLGNIFQVIWTTFGNQNLRPKYENTLVPGLVAETLVWKTVLTLEYPEHKTFEGISYRLNFSQTIAASKALHWLYEKGIITEKKRPLLYSKQEAKEIFENQKLPYALYFPPNIQSEMESALNNYKNLKERYRDMFEQLNLFGTLDGVEEFCENECFEDDGHSRMSASKIHDVFTDQPYCNMSKSAALQRNKDMSNQQTYIQNSSNLHLQQFHSMRRKMPIFKHREEIVKLIDENRVVVISGDTGSGKSTQVPQYIMENFINSNKGSDCNIVITQPRRISAIAISHYVAAERGEKVGSSVGYQVRLNKVLPQGNGSILYCTTGILLRKLCFNEELQGVSHVIIDEVHERNIPIDFLLILMKHLLETNKKLKLILMSATFNTSLFSQYFNNSPVVHVSGNLFPVTEYFLDDMPFAKFSKGSCFQLDCSLIAHVIAHLNNTQPPGAILCFLPGWTEIKSVSSYLNELLSDRSDQTMICLLHSRLLPEEQEQIFVNPSPGVRKIILATNIAETSITVEDVVYVVDSGFHKGTTFDTEAGISSLGMQRITKANVRQRRGRAGRVQPGVCYHVYSRKVFSHMDDYPVPEILRTPLEKVVLDCKVYCPNVKAEDFLSHALQPPTEVSVQLGVQELQTLGILDSNENLTRLGKLIRYFATHPRLSVAILFSTFLRCLDPVLTISAFLTMTQTPFVGELEQKKNIQMIKKKYDKDRFSDHLALYELYNEWNSIEDTNIRNKFAETNLLDNSSFEFIKRLKGLFLENLRDSGLISTSLDAYNCNSHDVSLVSAALTGACYPNVLKLLRGGMNHGKLDKDAVIYSSIRNRKAFIQDESVLSKEHKLPSPWLIHYSGLQSEARRLIMAQAVTSVPGVNFLFFAGKGLSIEMDQEKPEKGAVLVIDKCMKLSFCASTHEALLLSEWRQMIQELLLIFISVPTSEHSIASANIMEFLDCSTIPALKKILSAPQLPFPPVCTS